MKSKGLKQLRQMSKSLHAYNTFYALSWPLIHAKSTRIKKKL